MKRRILFTIAAALLVGGCSDPAFRISETRTHAELHIADSPLRVEGRNGRVEIVHDPEASEVSIEAVITCGGRTVEIAEQRLAASEVSVRRDTSRTLIVKPIFSGGAKAGDAARFTIRSPGSRDVRVRTSNGRVRVVGMGGGLDVTTSNGSVTAKDHDGSAVVRTSNGPVTLANVAGEATVSSSNGRIEVSLHPGAAGPVRLTTSNSGISLTVGSAFRGSVSMRTSNGRVRVEDPGGLVTDERLRRTSGRVVIGEGGATSVLRTSNGGIRLWVTTESAPDG
ncbi:MAG: DUF4097 family beta strand repeat-containing protein [Planctomycetota bacterium]|jgi:DUF4097 and DUF4098 domain-containing protein YvlB